VVKGEARLRGLGQQFLHRGDVTADAHGVAPAVGDDVGTAAPGAQRVRRLLQAGGQVIRPGPDDFCAQEFVQEQVALGLRWGLAAQDQGTGQAEAGGRGGGLAGVVGLGRAAGDQRVGPLGQRFGHQELQFAGLVPACRQPGLVVPFGPELGAAQIGRQTGQHLQRGREMRDGDSGTSVGQHSTPP
jgi:hypothetical protein